jgi:hypothetical protein
MDMDTLLIHRSFWTLESKFTKAIKNLEGLHPHERQVYEALHCLGDGLRLENGSEITRLETH